MIDDLELGVADSIFDIDPDEWDACAGTTPWVRHGFFRALERAGCLGPERGVAPKYVTLRDRTGALVACAPGMLKWGNKREYGPEIRWLEAGLQAGCFEWPKFQIGTPFYPRLAPRLLLHQDRRSSDLEAHFLDRLIGLAARPDGRSVFNLIQLSAETAAHYATHGALVSPERRSVSVWHNPGVESFEDYLRTAPREKRNDWRRERRRARSHGLRFDVIGGADVSDSLLADFYSGFESVCTEHGNVPWLPGEMFRRLCQELPESVVLMTAHDGDRYCAGVFCLVDGGMLYVDTWSARDSLPSHLLFEMGCHMPVEYAIDHGLYRVEAGLNALYKTLRGFTEEPMFNAHWFHNPELAALAAGTLQDCSE